MDIRLLTRIIIRRGPVFLVGRVLYSTEYRWSDCPWDAWWTRNIEDAKREARQVGGDLWLFNPVAGQLREMRKEGRLADGKKSDNAGADLRHGQPENRRNPV